MVTVAEDPSLLQTVLTSFYGELSDNGSSITVSWNTLREYENETFILETSYGTPDNFSEINNQPGNGTSTTPNAFAYEDSSFGINEIIFYRLKMITTNGVETFSPTIEVQREGVTLSNPNYTSEGATLRLVPNPVNTDTVTLSFGSAFSDGDATIDLYNIQGKKIYTQSLKVTLGANAFELQIPDYLSNGVYLVRLTTRSYIKTKRLIIRH